MGQRERKNCETCINKRKRNEKGEMVKKIQIKDTSHKIKYKLSNNWKYKQNN